MASTRNRNTQGDYQLEQIINTNGFKYPTYIHGPCGRPNESMYAGNGLVGGRIVASEMSHNNDDIESFLFGIGSTNLVIAQTPVTPQYKTLSTISVADRLPVFVPQPLAVQKDQREYLSPH